MENKPVHCLLLSWLILIGIIAFAVAVAWHEHIIQTLFFVDKSKISLVILLIFTILLLHGARYAYIVSTQYNLSQQIANVVTAEKAFTISIDQKDIACINQKLTLSRGIVTEYIRDLYHSEKRQEDDSISAMELIEVYQSRLKRPQEVGWFISDVILKLGLLGTIIGFIFMLDSVTNITDFDINTMQKILQKMSVGMGVALYTTLTGLICSILTALQYLMIDKYADQIIETVQRFTAIHIAPRPD